MRTIRFATSLCVSLVLCAAVAAQHKQGPQSVTPGLGGSPGATAGSSGSSPTAGGGSAGGTTGTSAGPQWVMRYNNKGYGGGGTGYGTPPYAGGGGSYSGGSVCRGGGRNYGPSDIGGGGAADAAGSSAGAAAARPPRGASTGGWGGAANTSGGRTRAGGATAGSGAPTLGCVDDAFTGDAGPEAWWTWWELHRTRFLPVRSLHDEGRAAPPGQSTTTRGALADAALPVVLPMLAGLLDDRDAPTRAAAAVAYGRLGGARAVDALLPLLADDAMLVRERAILALGATGSLRAAPTLLQLATDGRATRNGPPGRVSPAAEPLALLALGLGRRHGLSDSVDGFVVELARSTDRSAHRDRTLAALLFHTLSFDEDLGRMALEACDDAQATTELRCRATETLALAGDPAVLTLLDRRLHDGQLELRRSAALAFGSWPHPGVLSELALHVEHESEEVVRGFLLLSVAAQGGADARALLERELRDGDALVRPWASLALGCLAGAEDDDVAREALRQAGERERSQSAHLALLIARGIGGDGAAVPWMTETLSGSGHARERAVAATALALVGDGAAHAALRAGLAAEASDDVLAVLAEALGSFGDAADVPLLAAALAELDAARHATRAARALGAHGTRDALAVLVATVEARETRPAVRAAAIEALGLAMDPHSGPILIETAQASNFAVLPPWLDAALAGTTL